MAYFEVAYFALNPVIGKEKSNSPLFLCLLMFQVHIFLEFFFFFSPLKNTWQYLLPFTNNLSILVLTTVS